MIQLMLKNCLCLIALAAACLAQSEIGGATLNGTVTDPSGASVSGAKVRLSSTETGFNRAATTSDAGLYSFTRVPVGVYTLAIDHPGFKGVRQQGINLSVGAVVTLDIALVAGATQETVSVVADSPADETERTQNATTC